MKIARVLLIAFFVCIPLPLTANEILIVHCGAPSFAQEFARGLLSASDARDVGVSIENISRRVDYGKEVAALWQRQYGRVDLVIALDETSRIFVSRWSQRMFARAGLVALAYQPLPEIKDGWSYLWVAPDLRVSLSLLKRLRPGVRRVLLVVDPAQLSAAQAAAWLKTIQPFVSEMQVSLLASTNVVELADELRALGPDAAVVYAASSCGVGDDKANFAKIMSGVNVPVLGLWDTYLGQGLLGGNLLSAADCGRFMGERFFQLKGSAGNSYHPELSSRLVFDQRILKQLRIGRNRLPEAAGTIGNPHSVVWPMAPALAGVLILAWLLTLAWALWLRSVLRRCIGDLGRLGFEVDYVKSERARQQKMLDELQSLLLEGGNTMMAVADRQQRIVMMNPAFARNLGAGLNGESLSLLPIVEVDRMLDAVAADGRWAGFVITEAGARYSVDLRLLPAEAGLAAYHVLQLYPDGSGGEQRS